MKRENDGPAIIDVDGTWVTADVITIHRDGKRRTDFTMSTPAGHLGVVFRLDRGERPHDEGHHHCDDDEHVWYYRSASARDLPSVGPFADLITATTALLKAS